MFRSLLFPAGPPPRLRPASPGPARYQEADPGADRPATGHPPGPPGRPGPRGTRRPRPGIARSVKWGLILAAAAFIFRRAIASLLLTALTASLHFLGLNVHLPSVKFGWPWQALTAGTTTNTDLGPWVLQKIEGISRPALGQANFTFVFTRKVSKSIGIWPCWYASTFYAAGHAAATVDLNPGPAWWAPAAGHYRLQVLSRPRAGQPGQVTVTMMLPAPQLPRSAHAVTIDNIPSKPVAVQHSWTYPGFGCGVLLRPQFSPAVLYAQAQQIAYYKATHAPQVTGPLLRSAETEATQTIRDSFVQPTVNAFGYTLKQFTLRWAGAP